MSEPLKQPTETRINRRRRTAAYLAPVVAAAAMTYGAIKFAEAATVPPQELPVAANIKPALPTPETNFNKIYVAYSGETADDIVSETYPRLNPHTHKYKMLRNMVNNQISNSDEYNRTHPEDRMIPGPFGPVQLT